MTIKHNKQRRERSEQRDARIARQRQQREQEVDWLVDVDPEDDQLYDVLAVAQLSRRNNVSQ